MHPAQATPPNPRTAERDAFEAWLAADLAGQAGATLVVTPESPAPASLAAGAYAAIYLDRVLTIASPGGWLERARRALSPGGRLVLAVDPADFSFAPLPAGGDLQLLGRWLADAGFCRIELAQRSPQRLVVSAHRAERDPTR